MSKGNYWDDHMDTTLLISSAEDIGAKWIRISTTDTREFHAHGVNEEFFIKDEQTLDQIIAWLEKMRAVLKGEK